MCANLPYIPTATLRRLRVYGREPTLALDGGVDGLAKIRASSQDGRQIGSHLAVSFSWRSRPRRDRRALALAHETFKQAAMRLHQDLAGRDRLLAIELPGA